MKKTFSWIAFFTLVLFSASTFSQVLMDTDNNYQEDEFRMKGYTQNDQPRADRITYKVYKHQRGTTKTIPESVIKLYCGDSDGCKIRMGMYNWAGAGRVASREFLFFYNNVNHAWRSSAGDAQGTSYDGTTQHAANFWACYFTDGSYSNWSNRGDSSVNFGLLSWNQYNAECWMTIID